MMEKSDPTGFKEIKDLEGEMLVNYAAESGTKDCGTGTCS